MGRTLKRQQARARKEIEAISNSTPVVMSDELWTKLEDALIGLLHMEVVHSTRIIDHVYPRSVQLIVRLDLVRAGASDTVERVLQRVMDAVGMLCVLLEDSGDHPGVWTRVIRSQMMIIPWDTRYTDIRSYQQRIGLRELLWPMMVSPWHALEDEDVMRVVAASTHVHGLHVVFAWQERKFQSNAADAVGAFLRTPRHHYERCLGGRIIDKCPRLVRVGIQLVDCQLTTRDIVSIMKALTIKELAAGSDFKDFPLSGVYTLDSLTFKGVPLRVAELDVLAVGLASPNTRRVDGLSLEKMLTDSPKYVVAFKKVLAAALQSKHTDQGTACPGLKLSLASNNLIQPVHVEALQEALTLATRPLAALSVAHIPSAEAGTWLRLGQIFFTPSRIPVDGLCELDVSRSMEENNAAKELSLSLRTLIADLFPRMTAALSASDRVYCRVSYSDGDENGSENLSPLGMYEVVSIRSIDEGLDGWIQIKTPSAEESSTWISSLSISSLRIGDEDVVGCRFTSLVAQGDDYMSNIDDVPSLLRSIGHGLRYLDLGDRKHISVALPDVMVSCPNLEVLDLQDSRLSGDWDDMPLHSLQSINLRNCWRTASRMADLLTLILATPETPLRYLDLRGNSDVDSDTLDALLKLLQRNRTLLHVEMPYMCLASDIPGDVALRRQLEAIDEYVAGESASAEIKLAMLSVAEYRDELRWDEYIVRNILAFTSSDRVVGWTRSSTLKHQRARDHKPAAALTEEELWRKADDALLGLLDTEIDIDYMCPRSVKLIVRLDLVRRRANAKVEKVLHDAKAREIVAFTRAHGLHVVLSWQNRVFQSYAADAIGTILQSPRHKYLTQTPREVSVRPVQVSLQFVECKLVAHELTRVMEALAVPNLTIDSDFDDVPLCCTHSLQSLEFKGITLDVAGLSALAVGLASPHTRRVDGLILENAIVPADSPKYLPAVRQVLVAVLQAKHTDSADSYS